MDTFQIADEFERLIASEETEFCLAAIGDLPEWAQVCVKTMLEPYGIGWQLGKIRVGQAVCLKLDDPKLEYLDVFPETKQFIWCIDEHHSSVHPDEALVHCLRRKGVVAELGRGGSIILNDGEAVLNEHKLSDGDRVFEVRSRP